MKDQKKIEFIFDLNKELQQQIKSSKIIKFAMSATILMGGLLAIGVSLKVLSFTVANLNDFRRVINNR